MPPKRVDRPVDAMTLEAALDERERLVHDLMETQDALGNKNRCHSDGRRFTSEEYWEWHGRASHFVRKTQLRVAALKSRIKKLRADALVVEAGVTDTSDLGLLKRMYSVLVTLTKDGVELDPDEQALLNLVRDRLQSKS